MNESTFEFQQWRKLMKKHLQKSNFKYCLRLKLIIKAIERGIKPSLLLDFGNINLFELTRWFDDLKNCNAISQNLSVLQINGEIFIYNKSFLNSFAASQFYNQSTGILAHNMLTETIFSNDDSSTKINSHKYNKFNNYRIFVDISKGLVVPSIVDAEKTKLIYQIHLAYIINIFGPSNHPNNDETGEIVAAKKRAKEAGIVATNRLRDNLIDDIIKNKPDFDRSALATNYLPTQIIDDINFTTIYGLLLGYPVVYWYSNSEAGDCLNSLPLTLYRVFIDDERYGASPTDDTTIYSFTAPNILGETCTSAVNGWFDGLTVDGDRRLRLSSGVAVHSAVNM